MLRDACCVLRVAAFLLFFSKIKEEKLGAPQREEGRDEERRAKEKWKAARTFCGGGGGGGGGGCGSGSSGGGIGGGGGGTGAGIDAVAVKLLMSRTC